MTKDKLSKTTYGRLIGKIAGILAQARSQAVRQINRILVKTYWEIGREIVEHEQEGRRKAEYGEKLLEQLFYDLTLKFGKGFTQSALRRMRQFYCSYPICATLSHELSWSHCCLLVAVNDPNGRAFYEKETINNSWSVRQLDRQVNSMLYGRLALSKDKKEKVFAEYVLGGLSNKIFASKYKLALPKPKELKEEIAQTITSIHPGSTS